MGRAHLQASARLLQRHAAEFRGHQPAWDASSCVWTARAGLAARAGHQSKGTIPDPSRRWWRHRHRMRAFLSLRRHPGRGPHCGHVVTHGACPCPHPAICLCILPCGNYTRWKATVRLEATAAAETTENTRVARAARGRKSNPDRGHDVQMPGLCPSIQHMAPHAVCPQLQPIPQQCCNMPATHVSCTRCLALGSPTTTRSLPTRTRRRSSARRRRCTRCWTSFSRR